MTTYLSCRIKKRKNRNRNKWRWHYYYHHLLNKPQSMRRETADLLPNDLFLEIYSYRSFEFPCIVLEMKFYNKCKTSSAVLYWSWHFTIMMKDLFLHFVRLQHRAILFNGPTNYWYRKRAHCDWNAVQDRKTHRQDIHNSDCRLTKHSWLENCRQLWIHMNVQSQFLYQKHKMKWKR